MTDQALVLVINSGSSSVKFKVFAMPGEQVRFSGQVDGIGIGGNRGRALLSADQPRGVQVQRSVDCTDHGRAIGLILDLLASDEHGLGGDFSRICLAGHRVVHGGSRFCAPVILDDQEIDELEGLCELAPLHIPINVLCIRACREKLPKTPMTACFDTAFSHDLPEHARLYPVPMQWHEKYGIRRYGFHGISYQYVVDEAARMLDASAEDLKIIAAHLGNGSSITAVDRGRVADTSMGFTPLEGLMMGTRSGNFDPAVFPYIMDKTGLCVPDILKALNTKSGLLGISGISRDMRVIVSEMDRGCGRARLAFDMFVHVLRKFIGGYFFTLGGADAIVFTGGIGQNSHRVRQAVFAPLQNLGLGLDEAKNRATTGNRAGCIHSEASCAKILMIPADEERMIARAVFGLWAG